MLFLIQVKKFDMVMTVLSDKRKQFIGSNLLLKSKLDMDVWNSYFPSGAYVIIPEFKRTYKIL